MFNLILLAGLCLLSACAPKSAEDCQFSKNIYGKIRKHETLPLTLYVSPEFPEDYTQQLMEAAAEINRDRTYVQIYKSYLGHSKNYVNEIYLSYMRDEISENELAVTFVWWSAVGNIKETDIVINSQNYNFREDGHNFKRLMIHELLHALGMLHQEDDPVGIMYPYTFQFANQGMTEREYKNLECAYGK